MEILEPQSIDLIEIVYLEKVCYFELKSRGWLSCDKFKQFTLEDLKTIFILKLNNLTLTGLIKINISGNHPDISKNNNSITYNPLVIENIIIHPNWWSKNTGNTLLNFAEDYARKNGFNSVKVNTFSKNEFSIKLVEQLSYLQKEEFYSDNQDVPYYTFEKIL
jgi:GNAT superfamily N-acetyltransferase